MAPGCFLTPGSAFDSGSAGHAAVGAGLIGRTAGVQRPHSLLDRARSYMHSLLYRTLRSDWPLRGGTAAK
jgi:hypothetical protein